MKKAAYLIMVLGVLLSGRAYADTISDFVGDRLEPGKLQASYLEKYFEYTVLYAGNDINSGYYKRTFGLSYDMLSGIKQDYIARYGLTEDINISANMLYVFQKLGVINCNNVQSISFCINKYSEVMPGFMAGFRMPVTKNLDTDPRLINYTRSPSLILGLFYKGGFWRLDYSAQAKYELMLAPFSPGAKITDDCSDEAEINASLGFTIYNNPSKQKVSLIMETDLTAGAYDSRVLRVIPQARMEFYNDFQAILGLEFLADEENVYLNDTSKYLYTFKINYIINSDKRIVPDAAGGSGNAGTWQQRPGATAESQATPQATPQQ
jgi:hypothetical protein